MTVLAALLGVSAGLVGIFDTVPYLRDVMRGSTRPHRGMWLIWSALAVVCLSQWADGASWSLIMLLTQAVLTTGVFAVAIVAGAPHPHLRIDNSIAMLGPMPGAQAEAIVWCRPGRGRGCPGPVPVFRDRFRRPVGRSGFVRSGRARRVSRGGSRSRWWG